MSDTIAQLERKFDFKSMVQNNPLPALAIAATAGFLFSRSSRGGKRATASTMSGVVARTSVAGVANGVAERLFGGVADVLGEKVDGWVDDIRHVIVPKTDRAGISSARATDMRGEQRDARRD
ncbi:MAG: hypothetical protein M3Y05_05520 [Gemmatimonadota bacterium]|nr:hypothetical protein [Gemmatimonadota bacterium]